MNNNDLNLSDLWRAIDFAPNPSQEQAILHTTGPLYLPAGPGSGKTRVLLWRTLNLIVFEGVKPEEIYLSTFTEKAALQLQNGLRSLLSMVTGHTGMPYDISKMYVGTVHSLCRRLIADRRFYLNRQRGRVPVLLDELKQYFYLYHTHTWESLTSATGLGDNPQQTINAFFLELDTTDGDSIPSSKHAAVTNCIALFNRLSEECINPEYAKARATDPTLRGLLDMYREYVSLLQPPRGQQRTDFSLLQQNALQVLQSTLGAGKVFKHVIVDEYQDTNTVQERIFFELARGSRNICVVGDDDQALYRFRGATVENFVQFPERCLAHFGVTPTEIPLATNYRSRKTIVDFYTDFISRCEWRDLNQPSRAHRVSTKQIHAHSNDSQPAVIASTPAPPEAACAQIAMLVRILIDTGKVANANQIAFLYPSLKYKGKMTVQVERMKNALEAVGLSVYAPRAGRFLDVEESVAMFGLFIHVFGKPKRGAFRGDDYKNFNDWLDHAESVAADLMESDNLLLRYVTDRQVELATAAEDYQILTEVVSRNGWDVKAPYDIATMKRKLAEAAGLSAKARRSLSSAYFEMIIKRRADDGRPFSLDYIIRRATAIDWSVLDLFYRLCGFQHFRHMFDLAEKGVDEGPICNLGLISQYLGRFSDEYVSVITANLLTEDTFKRLFFSSYLFALFRRGESEYEDAEDPFPKGRIPFLTIHQSKGLEFPVVVLGNPRKKDGGVQRVEALVRDFVDRRGEPLERIPEFDRMRMFYVALSRAKNLLVLAHFKGRGQNVSKPFDDMIDDLPTIPRIDLDGVPSASLDTDELPENYSYTGDYLLYQRCPRQYMIFRRYGFMPARSLTMMFGSLVHRTLDDLHQYLISQRSAAEELS